MLKLEGIRLRQGEFTLIADLEIAAGQVVALMGPSGGGKSTLIAAIAGFLRPETGRLIWNGLDMTDMSPGERPISVLFQDNNLFPHLTVAQNLALGIRPNGRVSVVEGQRIETVLTQVGLRGLGQRKPGALSGGQQSRAALARVLLGGRPLVLLDEPFAALGPGLKEEMLELTARMLAGPGRCLIIVSHDPADAIQIADQVVGVEAGRVAMPVPVADFMADPPPGMRAYLGRGES